MTISRYRDAPLLEEKFPYRLNARTNKPKLLSFFGNLHFKELSPQALADIEYVEVSFSAGNTLALLASKAYGDPSYWWLIALINNVSSEHDIKMGQTLVILYPPDLVINELGL